MRAPSIQSGDPPATASALILSPEEVRLLSGGYVRPADQLRALHARGYHRAHRSTRTGRVVVERAHYDAVAAGRTNAPVLGERPHPRLRPPPP